MNQSPQFEMTIEEFYQIIGELETIRRKLFRQINEMGAEIERLRAENGRLVEPEDHK